MIKRVYGDIFNSDADVILHQVNCLGIMGGGVAKQVKERHPVVFDAYKSVCDKYKNNKSLLLGYAQAVSVSPGKYIVNLFAQENIGTGEIQTDYEALEKCLLAVNIMFAGQKVAIPYLMSCYRGGGDWVVVLKMIGDTLKDCNVTLYEYDGK